MVTPWTFDPVDIVRQVLQNDSLGFVFLIFRVDNTQLIHNLVIESEYHVEWLHHDTMAIQYADP